MQENDILEVEIIDFSNLGFGIAKQDGFVIFVEGACPGDVVSVKLTKVTKNYANAKTINVIKPSDYRVYPFCPLQNTCGACQLQFISHDYQLKLKQKAVQDVMKSVAGLDIDIELPVASPQIKEYRHKIQYPVSETKVSKRILAGYYKPATHEIVNIKYCPIQPKICDEIIEFIRNNASKYNISGYNEKKHSGDLRHIVIRNSADTNKCLVVLVVNATKSFKNLENFAQAIYNNFEDVSGICVDFNSKKTNVILSNKNQCLVGDDYITEKLLDKTFKIGAGTFFQINPKSAENIFAYVKNYIATNIQNATVLDAYAGIAAFGICVSDVCKKVVSVEENTQSCDMASNIIKENYIKNIVINNCDATKFLMNEKQKYDAIILDPPRKGCTKESLDGVYRLCKNKIIYVSCNPVTLARDLKYLIEKGAKIDSIKLFDMFCHTYHVETVAILSI